MLDKIKYIYINLPREKLRLLKYVPDMLLYGTSFMKYKNKLNFNANILKQNLFETLHYSRNYTQFGLENIPKDFGLNEVFNVLKDIPITTSQHLSDNIDYYCSKEYNKYNSFYTTTGGTGRNPTTILLSNESYGIEWAHMLKIWSVSGYIKKKNPKLTLRGNVLKSGELFEYNPVYNEYVANTYKMNNDNFEEFINLVIKKKIKFIHGYPSLLKEFYAYAVCSGTRLNLDGIFLGSEGITVADKRELGEFFKAKIVSWYGQTEKVILAQDLQNDNRFKVFTSYGYPAILNPDKNNFGELLGTSFVNKALPLINYSTGDYCKISIEDNAIYLEDIQGRWGKDYIYLSKDKKIPTSSLNLHSIIQKEIYFFQIFQSAYGSILINIFPKKQCKITHNQIIEMIKSDFTGKLDSFNVEYKIVEDFEKIIRSKRGKMIMLVQEIEQ